MANRVRIWHASPAETTKASPATEYLCNAEADLQIDELDSELSTRDSDYLQCMGSCIGQDDLSAQLVEAWQGPPRNASRAETGPTPLTRVFAGRDNLASGLMRSGAELGEPAAGSMLPRTNLPASHRPSAITVRAGPPPLVRVASPLSALIAEAERAADESADESAPSGFNRQMSDLTSFLDIAEGLLLEPDTAAAPPESLVNTTICGATCRRCSGNLAAYCPPTTEFKCDHCLTAFGKGTESHCCHSCHYTLCSTCYIASAAADTLMTASANPSRRQSPDYTSTASSSDGTMRGLLDGILASNSSKSSTLHSTDDESLGGAPEAAAVAMRGRPRCRRQSLGKSWMPKPFRPVSEMDAGVSETGSG